jgi:hypothetical protein
MQVQLTLQAVVELLTGSVRKVWAMLKNWSNGADRLANAARAAGFAMATPDDRPEDAPSSAPKLQSSPSVATAWTAAVPQRALVVSRPRTVSYQSMFRDWFAGLNWRAPA